MLFHSHLFVFVFLPLTLLGWFGLNYFKKGKAAQIFLAAMSLWFYAYLNIHYLWMLLGSYLVNWCLCAAFDHVFEKKYRKMLLAAGIVLQLGSLGYFKYTNFFLENVNALFRTEFAFVNVLLPVGISFYAFQQIAFLVDRYRREEKQCSLLDYLTFMTYFPQLLQGPILLGKEFLPQLHKPECRRFDMERFSRGLERFVIGLAKKA